MSSSAIAAISANRFLRTDAMLPPVACVLGRVPFEHSGLHAVSAYSRPCVPACRTHNVLRRPAGKRPAPQHLIGEPHTPAIPCTRARGFVTAARGRGWSARIPRRSRCGRPRIPAAFVSLDLVTRQMYGLAAGKLQFRRQWVVHRVVLRMGFTDSRWSMDVLCIVVWMGQRPSQDPSRRGRSAVLWTRLRRIPAGTAD